MKCDLLRALAQRGQADRHAVGPAARRAAHSPSPASSWLNSSAASTAISARVPGLQASGISGSLLGEFSVQQLELALPGEGARLRLQQLRWSAPRIRPGGGSTWLRIGFAVYCFLTATTLFAVRRQPATELGQHAHGPMLSAAAVPIGALSALVGIGGGSMLVPLLVWRGHAAVRAVGTLSLIHI